MKTFQISTSSHQQAVDVTQNVQEIVSKSNITNGTCVVYVKHATAGLIVNENADPNIQIDFFKAINQLIPEHNGYLHDKIDNNAGAHIKAALISPSQTFIIENKKIILGTWQALMLIDFDGPRERTVCVKIQGDQSQK